MTVIPLGEWLPDQPAHMNAGLTVCKNVIPASGKFYAPVKNLEAVTNGTISGEPKGAFTARDADGNVTVFVGFSTFLAAVTAASGYSDVSRTSGGSYQNVFASGNWRFTQMGQRVIATNFVDDVQSYLLNSSTDFAQLSADAPRARHCAVWAPGFLVLGHLDTDPQGVRWSGSNDPTSFPTLGSSDAKAEQSDSDTIEGEHGNLTALTGAVRAADGLAFMERALYRAQYVGPGPVFSILPVEGARGTPIPNSVIHHGGGAAYWGGDGFYFTDGATSVPIGDGKVDQFFLEDMDPDELDFVSSTYDPRRKLYLWNYVATDGNFKTLVFNWSEKRWALWSPDDTTDWQTQWILNSSTLGYTVDTADSSDFTIEDTTISPDDAFWAGGPPVLAAFYHPSPHPAGYHGKLGTFSGDNWAATLETGEADQGMGRRVRISGMRVLTDTESHTCAVGYRNKQSDSVSYSTASSPNADGFCRQNISTRFARARISIASAVSWNKLWAYEPLFRVEGRQ